MSVVVVSNYYLPNNTIFFENDIITMITWPLTVCHVTALSAHPACGSVGNVCLQWKMQTHGCGNSQKGFTAVSTWIPFVLLPLTFSEVFSSKTLYTCLKCNFWQSFTAADCKTWLRSKGSWLWYLWTSAGPPPECWVQGFSRCLRVPSGVPELLP